MEPNRDDGVNETAGRVASGGQFRARCGGRDTGKRAVLGQFPLAWAALGFAEAAEPACPVHVNRSRRYPSGHQFGDLIDGVEGLMLDRLRR